MKGPQVLKFVLIGESGVGKSSLLLRFVDGSFSPSFITTVGIDFKVRTIQLCNGTEVKLQIWDTAGQDRFRTITCAYYRSAQAVLIVFDVTQKESFDSLPYWMDQVESNGVGPSVVRILVANKSDLVEKRVVGAAEIKVLGGQRGYAFVETSALTGRGVTEMFTETAERVWKALHAPDAEENQVKVDVIQLAADELEASSNQQDKKSKCC